MRTVACALVVLSGCQATRPAVPARPADGRYTVRVRATHYFAGETHSDPDTDAGRSATGVPLRVATATHIGVCAVDPAVIPYGSRVIIHTAGGPRVYLAADTGGAVRHRTASGGTAPVIDVYSPVQIGDDYPVVTVVPYRGRVAFTRLTVAERRDRLNVGWTAP